MTAKFIIVGDIHLDNKCLTRTDDYEEALFKKLEFIRKLALKHKCHIITTGDLLNALHTPLYLLNKLLDLWEGIEWYYILGNHEHKSSINNDPTETISVLNHVKNVHQIHGFKELSTVNFFGMNYGDFYEPNLYTLDSFPKRLHMNQKIFDVFVTHDRWDIEELKVGNKVIIREYPNFPCSVHINGDIHAPIKNIVQTNGILRINPGSLMRTDRDGKDDIKTPMVVMLIKNNNGDFMTKEIVVPHTIDPFKEKQQSIEQKDWFKDFSRILSNQKATDSEIPVIKRIEEDFKSGRISEHVANLCIGFIQECSNS